MRSPGQPLDSTTSTYMGSRFGRDFSHVRVHTSNTNNSAAKSANELNALAYTLGHHIVFGKGQYNPGTNQGKKLIAHELVHVIQQEQSTGSIQRRSSAESTWDIYEHEADRIAEKIVSENVNGIQNVTHTTHIPSIQRQQDTENISQIGLRVFIIGSPSPGEIRANHPFQFIHAALSQGVDENTVWIVERTGYEAGGVNLGTIEAYISQGQLIWLTPDNSLVDILNYFPHHSINQFFVFSHGIPGQVTLRYNWDNLPNYGLSIPETRQVNANVFDEEAQITFDSCNTGTSDFVHPRGNLAQVFAQQSGHPVEAWTGRTSYSAINDAQGAPGAEVEASEIFRHLRRPDLKEMGSQFVLDREPERRVFSPVTGRKVGGFSHYFEIKRRLPSTREFEVPNNGSVIVRCPNPEIVFATESEGISTLGTEDTTYGTASESNEAYATRLRQQTGEFWVSLYRREFLTDGSMGMFTFPVHPNREQAVWADLSEGTYYLEIYRLGGNSNFSIRSDIVVDVYGN
ncbi:MAG: DUF4157 domain-containing protein [Cyanobacteria bacterium P01_G01_bin.67]